MSFMEIVERTASVRVLALLKGAPALDLRDRDGGIVPSQIMITYSSPVGGASWSAQVLLQGTRTPPRPGREGELMAVFLGELREAPDWVAAFVELIEPGAALRGGVS